MIIVCINCSKKFDIDSTLIPEKGRLLQCSSCNHQWFFKRNVNQATKKPSNKVLISREELGDQENKLEDHEIKLEDWSNKKDKNKKLDIEESIKKKPKKYKILNLTIVFIITFVTFVILIDTFKYPISKIVPNIEFILYNLYESIKDIKLFFNDLI